ncbi:diguanylate cyclase domain-containing protein [Mesorhizobium qingshengii]|uniref:Diguanylate cyclase (GGDEF) domain-containing protein n=1 Tax=Mesorhizobium qingshengii TaxID=1165689 RepID=A0A1G5ZN94_9HYPH|nr:diguanylate cyclase [Mesorhizobium qingshengii]SDA96289.1 diguanylate cyclase (GGDEF) domain-containing protein [Mesorhizobium qingshengii]
MPDTPYIPKGPARADAPRAGRREGNGSRSDERRRDAATIARLKAELAAQAALIASQEVSLAHSRKIFDRASVAARLGVWECSLPDVQLQWTDVVYDLFDLPRGSALDRAEIVKCYPAESRKALETMRSRAIEERSGFTLDAEITTFAGRSRWIRITATVECEDGVPVRIFGIKQDITEEKSQSDRMRHLAEFDAMTGLANRGRFQARLAHTDEGRPLGALLLIDLDGFKAVNDTFGHVVGDECLKTAAQRLADVCGEADLVARVGGDEFAVLLGAHLDRGAVSGLARRIIEAMGKPVAAGGQSLKLGASVGIAFAATGAPCDLFLQADTALYAAKAAGRNTFRIFKTEAGVKGRSAAA